MKVLARILLILSYLFFMLWVFYHAKLYKLPDNFHWIIASIGAVMVIFSWIFYHFQERKKIDPFGLDEDLQTEKPEQTSYMICFVLYALIGLGALGYFFID